MVCFGLTGPRSVTDWQSLNVGRCDDYHVSEVNHISSHRVNCFCKPPSLAFPHPSFLSFWHCCLCKVGIGVSVTGQDDYRFWNGAVSKDRREPWSTLLSGVFRYLGEGLKWTGVSAPHPTPQCPQGQWRVKPAQSVSATMQHWGGHFQWQDHLQSVIWTAKILFN